MPNKAKTVAVTGANGFVGAALVNHFANKNFRVIALVRKPPKTTRKNVLYKEYDLAKKIDDGILKGADYLVHAAYVKQDRGHPDAFDINVSAAKNLVAAARKQKLKKCLFMSSMSAHEEAVSAYGRQKLAIEKIFKGQDCICVRWGLIIGPGGLVRQMVGFMRSKHMVPLVGGGKQPLQIVGIDDLVAVIDKLLRSDMSGIYTIATPQVYSYKTLYQSISRQLKIRVLFIPIPFFVLINTIRFISFLRLPLAVNTDNALGLKQLKSVDTKNDLRKIGVRLQSLETALAKAYAKESLAKARKPV